MMRSKRAGLRTWVEIDTKKAQQNFTALKKLLDSNIKFAAVTKSNAYGHGLVEFSRLMEGFGADWICVDSIMEARALREAGVGLPILVMGYTLPENFPLALQLDASITVSTFENLRVALKPRNLKVHLKFDTGMTRQGFLADEVSKIVDLLGNETGTIEGIYTHFAKAKVPAGKNETDQQLQEFNQIVKRFRAVGMEPVVHAAATSAVIVYKDSHFDLVRIGIGVYGLWPEKAVKKVYHNKLRLEPVLSWRSIISEIKEVAQGRGVGYDLTYRLDRDSRLAVCPVGYWHGYDRLLSNQAYVLIHGRRARVLGRVSMGMIVLDVTDIREAKVGDEVTLIGRDGREEISVEELADMAETINYEIVTRINPYIRRFYL